MHQDNLVVWGCSLVCKAWCFNLFLEWSRFPFCVCEGSEASVSCWQAVAKSVIYKTKVFGENRQLTRPRYQSKCFQFDERQSRHVCLCRQRSQARPAVRAPMMNSAYWISKLFWVFSLHIIFRRKKEIIQCSNVTNTNTFKALLLKTPPA